MTAAWIALVVIGILGAAGLFGQHFHILKTLHRAKRDVDAISHRDSKPIRPSHTPTHP